MKLYLFFISKASRVEFMKNHLNIDDISLDADKSITLEASDLLSIRLKNSHKKIPGYWLELAIDKTTGGKKLFSCIVKSHGPLLDKNIFYPKEDKLKFSEVEGRWKDKYNILDNNDDEDKWQVFFAEIKSHIKGKRYNTAFNGLLVIMKYNPFFFKKYKRYYVFEEMAYHFEENNNLGKAIKALKIHIMLQPDSVEPYLNMSSFYIINGMEEEAVKICNIALKKKPNNKYLISNLIIALNNMGNYDYALDYLKKSISKQPNNGFLWKLLGDIHYEQEDNEGALSCYNKALEKLKVKNIDDFTIDLYNGIAATHCELGNYDDAVKNYRKALKLAPEDSYTLFNISQIYLYKLKNYKMALLFTKKLIELLPDNGYGQYQLGIIYLQMENFEKAKWHLYKARKMIPGYDGINEAINFLKQSQNPTLDE